MIFKLCAILGLVALVSSYPVTYQDEAPQQQRLQAAPAPQYRYVQQQPQAQQYQAQPQQYQAQPQQYQAQPQQYQAQPQQYQAQPQYQQVAAPQRPRKLRPAPAAPAGRVPIGSDGNPLSLEDQEYDANPAPYQFSFDVQDDLSTNYQNRKEQREGDKITGSYSVVDSDGFIRTVKYTADPIEGFKAEVTREPTDIKVNVPVPAPLAPVGPSVRQQQTQQYLQAAPQFAAPQQSARRPQGAAPRPRQQYVEQPSQAQPQYAAAAQPQQYIAPAQRAKTAAYFAPQQAAQYQGYAQQ